MMPKRCGSNSRCCASVLPADLALRCRMIHVVRGSDCLQVVEQKDRIVRLERYNASKGLVIDKMNDCARRDSGDEKSVTLNKVCNAQATLQRMHETRKASRCHHHSSICQWNSELALPLLFLACFGRSLALPHTACPPRKATISHLAGTYIFQVGTLPYST